ALRPLTPAAATAMPRNALVVLLFSDRVDPSSVDRRTIAIRSDADPRSTPEGSLAVDGSRVVFDPTVTETGEERPWGLEAESRFQIDLLSEASSTDVV